MSNDIRIVKFQMMIRDIWEDLGKVALTRCCDQLNGGGDTALLAIIYDYDKLNGYGKAVMDRVCELDENESDYESDYEDFLHRVEFVEECKDMEYRMKAAKALVTDLNDSAYSDREKLCFIFWSLMILSVDDTDKEEHLSLICDFAKMLKISDEEMLDIMQIIQAIYHMEGDFTIKTRDVKKYFEKVIIRYGVKVNTGAPDEIPQSILGILEATGARDEMPQSILGILEALAGPRS